MRAALVQSVIASLVSAAGGSATLTSDGGHATAGEDCTAAAYADYLVQAVFANGSADTRKNGVNRIGAPALVGGAARLDSGSGVYTDVTYTGTDGNPTASFSIGSTGFYSVTALGTDKVSVTIPLPNTAVHTVKIACGVVDNTNGAGTTAVLRASLSGGGVAPTADTITSGAGATFKEYTFSFNANSGGQSLVLTLEASNRATTCWLLLNRVTYQ